MTFPDMSNYRRDSTKNTQVPARDTEDQRRALPTALYYGGSNYFLFGLNIVLLQLEEFYLCGPERKLYRLLFLTKYVEFPLHRF